MSASAFGADRAQLLTPPHPSTFNPQPTGAPLNQRRRFSLLRRDDDPHQRRGVPGQYSLSRRFGVSPNAVVYEAAKTVVRYGP